MSDYNFFYSMGQRDGLAELAMEARRHIEKSKYSSDKELESVVSLSIDEYIKPYENWDTLKYHSERKSIIDSLSEREQYDLGKLSIINSLKGNTFFKGHFPTKIELLCFYVEQYDIHYEAKSRDESSKNPHVQFLRGILMGKYNK